MHYSTLFPILGLLLSVSLAVPIPSECSCKQSPLSRRSIDYIDALNKDRPLTKDECSFICNPSPGAQKKLIGSPKSYFKTVVAVKPESQPIKISNAAKVAAYRNANHNSQAGSPLTWTPTQSPAAPVSRITGFRSQTGSNLLSFQQRTFLPFMLQLLASLALLFMLSVVVVELGDMVYLFLQKLVLHGHAFHWSHDANVGYRRFSARRGRSNSGSGRIRLEDDDEEKLASPRRNKGFKTVRWQ
jgi:hypothetical protein